MQLLLVSSSGKRYLGGDAHRLYLREDAELVIVRRDKRDGTVTETAIWSSLRTRRDQKPFKLVLDDRGNLNVLDARGWVAWSSNTNLDVSHQYRAQFSDKDGELSVMRGGAKVWSTAWSADQIREARMRALNPGHTPEIPAVFRGDLVTPKAPRTLIGNPVGNKDILTVEKFVKQTLHPV